MPKNRKGQPVFDDCQGADLNQDPNETPIEKLSRASAKRERARIRRQQDPEKYRDADETERSADASMKIATTILEDVTAAQTKGNAESVKKDNDVKNYAQKEYRYYRKLGMSVEDARSTAMVEVGDKFKNKDGTEVMRKRRWITDNLRD